VAVKNHGNAALNPHAQFRKPRTLEQVLDSPRIAGALTSLMCTPRGEGAAAVIVASQAGIERLGLDRQRAVRVLASVSCSEHLAEDVPAGVPPIVELVRQSARSALQQAGLAADALDLIELHDAFSIEELVYAEAIGACAPGDAAGALARGDWAHRRALRRQRLGRLDRHGSPAGAHRHRPGGRDRAPAARRGHRPPAPRRPHRPGPHDRPGHDGRGPCAAQGVNAP
jgi:acetyl-CoA acetyltransferase